MKKVIMLAVGIMVMCVTNISAAVNGQRFINTIEDEIYRGIRTGQLTNGEVRTLQRQLYQYEEKLWQFNDGRISRQEQKLLRRMEQRLLSSLEDLRFNAVTASNQTRRGRWNQGFDNGRNRPGAYYDVNRTPTRSRATATRRTPNRGGAYCPPSGRRNW